VPNALITVTCVPDDGWSYHSKYVEQFAEIQVSIKSFPDYKHLLQENYVEHKHIFFPKI